MIPGKLLVSAALLSVLIVSGRQAFSQSETKDNHVRVRGKCVQSLIEIHNDMKRDKVHRPIDQLQFMIDEGDTYFEITVTPSSSSIKGDCVTYKCSKTSGKILERTYGK